MNYITSKKREPLKKVNRCEVFGTYFRKGSIKFTANKFDRFLRKLQANPERCAAAIEFTDIDLETFCHLIERINMRSGEIILKFKSNFIEKDQIFSHATLPSIERCGVWANVNAWDSLKSFRALCEWQKRECRTRWVFIENWESLVYLKFQDIRVNALDMQAPGVLEVMNTIEDVYFKGGNISGEPLHLCLTNMRHLNYPQLKNILPVSQFSSFPLFENVSVFRQIMSYVENSNNFEFAEIFQGKVGLEFSVEDSRYFQGQYAKITKYNPPVELVPPQPPTPRTELLSGRAFCCSRFRNLQALCIGVSSTPRLLYLTEQLRHAAGLAHLKKLLLKRGPSESKYGIPVSIQNGLLYSILKLVGSLKNLEQLRIRPQILLQDERSVSLLVHRLFVIEHLHSWAIAVGGTSIPTKLKYTLKQLVSANEKHLILEAQDGVAVSWQHKVAGVNYARLEIPR